MVKEASEPNLNSSKVSASTNSVNAALRPGPRASTIYSRVERALGPSSDVREKCIKEADKMHAGENFRLFAAILKLEYQQETLKASDRAMM